MSIGIGTKEISGPNWPPAFTSARPESMPRYGLPIAALFSLLASWDAPVFAELGSVSGQVEFNRDVRPILSDKCFRCHGPDAAKREAELRLDRRDDAVRARSGGFAIKPGNPLASELVRRITSTDDDERMPPRDSGSVLSPTEIEILRTWIEQGAKYQPHWAFISPRSPAIPQVSDATWCRNPIDRFVLAELERRGMNPSPEASDETLARRLALDLTGLPSPRVNATAKRDYDSYVDELLASSRYGERMALDWLDAARYADTNGYYTDLERNAWPWRDWVIGAFNRNMPFDRFTIEQLAGDLLPGATTDQKIATGFNRNHPVTNESGVIDEEFRVSYVVDRLDTTATVWLGLSLGCARCHDHKYDPITQREYYQLFSLFNNVPEKGLVKDPVNPQPALMLPTAEQEKELANLKEQRERLEANRKAAEPALAVAMKAWEKNVREELREAPTKGLLALFDFNGNGLDHGPRQTLTETNGMLAFSPGVLSQAASFDATQYIEFDGPLALERTTPFSLSTWIKPGSSPQGCVVSKISPTADARGFEIIWYKSQPRINLVHHWGRDAIEVVAKQTFGSGQWRHLTVTYDGSGRAAGLNIYVDGQLQPVVVRRDSLTGSIATDEPWQIAWKGSGVGFEGGLDELRLYDRPLAAEEVEALYWRDMLRGAVETPVGQRSKQQQEQLRAYYVARHASEELRQLEQDLATVRTEEEAVRKAILSTPVMQEMEQSRATSVLVRGQYDQPGTRVAPDVPAALGTWPEGTPRNRLGFAQWLVSENNPLTARVVVNRYWQLIFGEGLVRTPNDFGLQGELPTHPELLDWLAVRFIESGWDVKALLKLIVTSSTYRQSSHFTSELLARDPDNRMLARAPRFRLQAELIRDQALAVGGLLVEKLGGPSAKPYQPPGIWEAVSYNGDQSYQPDHGAGLYRRSLYTFWKRQAPPPAVLAFDGPTREVCTVRRARTNTPLQALVLLNDVTYVEAARGLAMRMVCDGGRTPAERVEHGFRLATGRRPMERETKTLINYFERQLATFNMRLEAATALLRAGESPIDTSLDPRELAAWTMTASLLLNLDEVITRN